MSNRRQEMLSVQKLEHRKSPGYVQEYADRVNLLISDTPGMPISMNLIFGRDTAEVVEEQVQQTPEGKSVMAPSSVTPYRYDVASITLPEAAAKTLAESILAAIKQKSEAPGEA